jgi:hypothetical protein
MTKASVHEASVAGAEGTMVGTGTGLAGVWGVAAVAPAPAWAPAPDLSFALKLAGWSILGRACFYPS